MAVPSVAQPVSAIRDDYIMDTRTHSTSPVQRSPAAEDEAAQSGDAPEGETASYQPDLSQEVAMLSTKLVNAINHQTNLDDSLQATRHELEQSRQEAGRIRAEKQSLDDAIAQGVLVKKSEVDKTIALLREELAKEKASREAAERAKRQTDGELETLTANLFEEANKMVAQARKDTDAVEKRNSQLKTQIQDTEMLVASQQEQLQDLKLTMEKLERADASAREVSMPSSPINPSTATFDALNVPPSAATAHDVPPNQPLHFSNLLAPVLRTDMTAYTDFAELLGWARRGAAPHSRSASGNQTTHSQNNLTTMNTAVAAATSSPNLPGAFSFGGGSTSANSSPSSSSFATFTPPLKESKFYKRALIEDVEPTLRLDLAPGLSFLSRRTVNSALLNGTLSIEPFNLLNAKFYSPIYACSLCGESRKEEPYARKHRFRTSEAEDTTRYPLCFFCLERVRASADFVGFLRNLRDGLWRCGSGEEERAAWEEAVKLRERMFWARVGGGVVPAMARGREGAGLERIEEAEAPKTEAEEDVAGQGGEAQNAQEDLEAQEEDDEGGEEGIGRAIVNMASRAASTAVPELHPTPPPEQQDETANPPSEDQGRSSSSASVHHDPPQTPDQKPQTSEEAPAATESQTDTLAAEEQLQREASADIGGKDDEMRTPPESPLKDDSASPLKEEKAPSPSKPAEELSPPEQEPTEEEDGPPPPPPPHRETPTLSSSRPTSSSSDHRRSPSPRKGATSNVLARVRAMDGKGGS